MRKGYYGAPLGLNNVDWLVDDVKKKENKKSFYFHNTKNDTIVTQKDKEDFENDNICQFCQKHKDSDKVRVHCPLTGAYSERLITNVILMLSSLKKIFSHYISQF